MTQATATVGEVDALDLGVFLSPCALESLDRLAQRLPECGQVSQLAVRLLIGATAWEHDPAALDAVCRLARVLPEDLDTDDFDAASGRFTESRVEEIGA